MKLNIRAFLTALPILLLLSVATVAQHKHTDQKTSGTADMQMDMSSMMRSPHHKLMIAYLKSMTAFASTLHEQTMKPAAFDVQTARDTVAELRHNLDAMDTLHQKHMQTMDASMQSQMKMMMEKMDKDRATLKDQVSALETDVQADKPDAVKVRLHTDALLKHLGMMSMMHSGSKAPKKKAGMKMDMKKM